MERMSLPPGFRFHPTDVELIMYYLKRKAMRKKLHAEAIAEVNIYKFSPWDLPDMSCLKSKDQEWFFFCPIERKYASGARVKRATENGYWKTTGKERFVYYDDKTVGTVKTLVFHFGHAPKGERTDWVIHEYKILDDQLAAAEIQDTYVLCKVFKKNGPGPKVGANYGAPFTEEDWSDDYIDVAENHATSLTPDVPSDSALLPKKQGCVTGLLDSGSMACPLLIGEGSNEMQTSVVTKLFHRGSTSGLPLVEGLAPSTKPASELIEHEFDDDITSLWTSFTDDTLLLINENRDHKDDLSGKREKKSVSMDGCNDIYSGLQGLNSFTQMNVERLDPAWMHNDDYTLYNMFSQENSDYIELNDLQAPLNCSTGYKENSGFQDDLGGKREKNSVHMDGCHDIYSGLQDLNSSVQMNGERLDPAWMQNDDFTLYNMLLQDNSDYIELNDLQAPLNCSTGVIGNNDQVYDTFESYNHGNVPQFCFTCMDHTACYRDQLHVLTDRLDWKENHFDGHHRVNNQFYQESDAVYDSTAHTQSSNGEIAGLCFNQDMNGNR